MFSRRTPLFDTEHAVWGGLLLSTYRYVCTACSLVHFAIQCYDMNSRLQACEIGPGEALYIPPFWWHHVTALTANVSVLLPWDLSAAEQSAAARPWTQPGWGQ